MSTFDSHPPGHWSASRGLRFPPFSTAHGLKLHTRFVPSIFDRSVCAADGVPTCRACHRSFKQWPGLLSHLLSGACPEPDALQALETSSSPAADSSVLGQLRVFISAAAKKLVKIAKSSDAQECSHSASFALFERLTTRRSRPTYARLMRSSGTTSARQRRRHVRDSPSLRPEAASVLFAAGWFTTKANIVTSAR